MTGTFGFSLKIASGSSTSPLRSPSASKNGACMAVLDLPRVRLARRTLGLDLLGRLLDEDQRAGGAGYASLDHDEVPFVVDPDDPVGPCGRALVAHLAGHAHALEHPGRIRGADGAGLPDVHRTVGLRAAAELVPLDEALEALALARAGDVDELAGLEDLGLELRALLDTVVVANLDHVAVRVKVCLLEHAKLTAAELCFLDRLEGDPDGLVAVFFRGSEPEDPARPGLEDGDGARRAVRVEELGHTQLFR